MRLITEIEILLNHRNGITLREFADKVRSRDPGYSFHDRTIRRDCNALEERGFIEPKGDESAGSWRIKASSRLKKLFGGM